MRHADRSALAWSPQPDHEQPHLFHPGVPVPAVREHQRRSSSIPPAYDRVVSSEPSRPKRRSRRNASLLDHSQALIQRRPIPRARRQPHRKRPHPHVLSPRRRRRRYSSHMHHNRGGVSHNLPAGHPYATSCNTLPARENPAGRSTVRPSRPTSGSDRPASRPRRWRSPRRTALSGRGSDRISLRVLR